MGEIQQDFFQRIDGRFDLGADVIDSRRYLAVYGGHIGPGHVLDVDEITGLFAIAENRQIFPAGQGPGKEADDAAFPAVSLAFTVYIGVAQDGIGKTEQVAIELDIFFRRHFRQAVE